MKRYCGAGTVASLFLGKSTKEMSRDLATFTAAISGLIFFYMALLFGRQDDFGAQDLIDRMLKDNLKIHGKLRQECL